MTQTTFASVASAIASTVAARAAALTEYQRFINRRRPSARARGEHAFHVIKRVWGFTRCLTAGLAKNTARLFTAFALANLYLLRRRLVAPQCP